MMDAETGQSVVPFGSASELREEHISLLAALDSELKRDASKANEAAWLVGHESRIRKFLEQGAATGIYIEEIKERAACQILLNYWVTGLSRAGVEVADIFLDSFDSEKLPDLSDKPCPYVGLEAFQDKNNFYGREASTRNLLEKIRNLPLVVVIGASGSGKSSLVMGGVLPALQEKGAMTELRIFPPFVPGNTVLENLVNAALQVHPDSSVVIADEVSLLRKDPMRLSAMVGGANALPTLITIDQFEEVFTLSTEEDRDALVESLAKFLESNRDHRVILTTRDEFKSQLGGLRALSPYLAEEAWYFILPMSREGLKAAVEKPAAAVNLQFQAGIVDDLVNRVVDQDTALPLLQFTLQSLWEKRRRNRITREVYDEVGDPLSALEDWANKFYARERDYQDEIKRILLELVRVDEKLEVYRQPVPKSRLITPGKANTEKVLDLLEKNGFVRIKRCTSDADTIVEVKHESLIRNWPEYVKWIQEKRDKRLPLTKAAKRWEESGNSEGLFTEYQLEQVKAQPDLSDLEKEFIAASAKHVERMKREAEKRRAKLARARLLAANFGFLAALLIVFIIVYRYLFVSEYQSYYNTVVKVHGIPHGVCELTRSQHQKREVSLRIVKKGYWGDDKEDILRMEAVNGSGQLTTSHNVETYFKLDESKPCKWEYIRDSKKRIMYEKAYDKSDKLVWVLIYSPPPEGLTISRSAYIRDSLRRIRDINLRELVRALLYGPPGEQSRTRDALYLTEQRTERTPEEKPIRSVTTLQPPPPDLSGAIKTENPKTAKEAGTKSKETTEDAATVIPFILSRAKIVSIYYDKNGREERRRYFDGNRNPIEGPDGAFGQNRLFYADGLEAKIISVNRDGEPMIDEAGNASMIVRYDKLGNPVLAAAFDASGNPVMLKSGYHLFKASYDDQGNTTEYAYYGVNGERALHKDGYHKAALKYDSRGNPNDLRFFGLAGERMLFENRYHKVSSKYDERGNRIEWAYFGTNEESILPKNGYHKAIGRYDDRGHQIEWAYFGIPIGNTETRILYQGYHKETSKYDERGNRKEWAYFGAKGEPILHKDGYHMVTGKYDERGNRIEWAYFGAKGEPILHKDGYHMVTGKYGDRHNREEWAYFGAKGEPILYKDGYHKITRKYNDRGKETEWAYFGIPIGNTETRILYQGYHKETSKYDDRGNREEWAYFGTNEEPILHKNGYHKAIGRYNDRGNRIEWAYFGIPIGNTETRILYQGYHKETGKYDDRGNRIEWAYFGTRGAPILRIDGYHMETGKYDDRDNRTKWAYFGAKGEPILHKDGYHMVTGKYDDRDNRTEWAYFGTKGEPILHKNGYHMVTGKYDDRGNRTEWAYFGAKGEPILDKDGYHMVTGKYDDRGNQTEWAYFGTKKQPILDRDGYHKLTGKYDDRGNQTEWVYFDIDGNPVMINDGYSRVVKDFGVERELLEMSTFDTKGKLVVNKFGYARAVRQYDKSGNLIEIAAFGTEGELMVAQVGYARMTIRYDGHGNQTEEAYFGADDMPIVLSSGCARLTYKYDRFNHVTERCCYGVSGGELRCE